MYGAPAPPRTHLTVVGASTRAGDLIGTGTISGPEPSSAACLLELTEAGQPHIALPDGPQRGWLEDGDEVTLRGGVRRDGTAILSFGQLSGRSEERRVGKECVGKRSARCLPVHLKQKKQYKLK